VIGVIDTETTGLDDKDEVVEVAVVLVDDAGRIVPGAIASLVRPTVPISIPARATHHISPADVAGAPRLADVSLPAFDVVAGHNVEFDLRLLRQSGRALPDLPAIDTCRVAKHLYPEAPGFSNQVLRYYLELEVDLGGMPPHRALADAIVTAAILGRMLAEAPVDHLIDLSTMPAVLNVVQFGKHRGKRWAELDLKYLVWVVGTDMDADVIHTAKTILKSRKDKREALP
jgi:exodeoxyribonuclease X